MGQVGNDTSMHMSQDGAADGGMHDPGMASLLEAPTYAPEEEDLMRPLEYIRKIATEAEEYGIARIVPPPRWSPASRSPYETELATVVLPVRSDNLGAENVSNDATGSASPTHNHRSVADALEHAREAQEQFLAGERKDWLEQRTNEILSQLEEHSETHQEPDWSDSLWEISEARALEELFWKTAGSDSGWNADWCPPYQAAEAGSALADDSLLSAPPQPPVTSISSASPSNAATSPGIVTPHQQHHQHQHHYHAGNAAQHGGHRKRGQSSGYVAASGFAPMRGGMRHPMDLMRFGSDRGNLLALVGNNTLPARRTELEVGSVFSYTPWAYPPHALMRVHYLHSGCSKTWYSSAGKDAADAIVQGGHIGCLMSQSEIAAKTGATTTRAVQTPGTFIVVCNGNVFQTFNHGPLLGEGTLIGSPEWLFDGRKAVEKQREGVTGVNGRSFSHEELVVKLVRSFLEEDKQFAKASKRRSTAAEGGDDDVEKETGYAETLLGEIKAVAEQENTLRRQLEQQWGMSRASGESVANAPKGEPCNACGARVYASVIRCRTHPNQAICLRHPEHGCGCPGRYLCCRVSDTELERLQNRLTSFIDFGTTRQIGSSKRSSRPAHPAQI